MAKLEKRLKKWASKPTEVDKDEVISVLERFGFELDFKKSSHIVVRHAKLLNQPGFGSLGEFTVPTKHGRFVKGVYLKEILLAIEIVIEEK
jgi:predicted RNA binding protein YcfA (HicA-like mRNA interferase family)